MICDSCLWVFCVWSQYNWHICVLSVWLDIWVFTFYRNIMTVDMNKYMEDLESIENITPWEEGAVFVEPDFIDKNLEDWKIITEMNTAIEVLELLDKPTSGAKTEKKNAIITKEYAKCKSIIYKVNLDIHWLFNETMTKKADPGKWIIGIDRRGNVIFWANQKYYNKIVNKFFNRKLQYAQVKMSDLLQLKEFNATERQDLRDAISAWDEELPTKMSNRYKNSYWKFTHVSKWSWTWEFQEFELDEINSVKRRFNDIIDNLYILVTEHL